MQMFAKLAPFVFVLGCADNLETVSPDEIAVPGGHDNDDNDPTDESLDIDFFFINSNCDVGGWDIETAVTRADGSFVGNAECRFVFDDGATADFCTGFVELTPGQRGFRLGVRDPETGATATLEGTRPVAQPLAVTLEASAGCLSISWAATVTPPTFRILSITPPENVLADQPLPMTGDVAVTMPGIYEVTLFAEDERSTGPICTRRIAQRVEVSDCPEPPPPCELAHDLAMQ